MYVRVTVNFSAQDQKVAALFCTSYFSADPLRLMECRLIYRWNLSCITERRFQWGNHCPQARTYPCLHNSCSYMSFPYTYVWGCSPAYALFEINSRGSTRIQQLNAVTWYPPACCWVVRTEKQTTFTIVFDKLLAMCRDNGNERYLRDTAHSCPR